MKTYHKLILVVLAAFTCIHAYAQTAEEKKNILRQGIALNDSGKYDQAIEKYKQLIKIDSNYADAYYETGFTLFSSGRESEAIPYLERALKLQPNSAQCYDMLGSIYDDLKQSDKAIDLYKKGVSLDSTYQRLHYNLAITYYRVKKYPESEAEAIKAIKLDATHASSQRIYGLALSAQDKNACAVLAFCNFLLLEPQSKRSVQVYHYIDTIFKLQQNKSIVLRDKDFSGKDISQLSLFEMSVNLGVTTKDTLAKLGKTSPVDQMMIQLQIVFNAAGNSSEHLGAKKDFFWKFYGDYFQDLVKSGNLAAFTHYITLGKYQEEDLAWFKEHDKELKDLQHWIQDTKRDF